MLFTPKRRVYHQIEEISDGAGSSDDSAPEDAVPPPPQQRPAKRRRSAGTAKDGSTAQPPPPAPLTADTAVGLRAIAPAAMWPSEQCRENGGVGWNVVVEQVDKRLGAAVVRFTSARDAKGNRYAREWLKLKSLRSGTTSGDDA